MNLCSCVLSRKHGCRATSFSQKSRNKIRSYPFQNLQKSQFKKLCSFCARVHFTLKNKVYGGSDAFSANKFGSYRDFFQLRRKILLASSRKSGAFVVRPVRCGVKCRISKDLAAIFPPVTKIIQNFTANFLIFSQFMGKMLQKL